MWEHADVMLRFLCIGLVLINAPTGNEASRISQEALDQWIQENSRREDPFEVIKREISQREADRVRNDYDRYMDSARTGSVQQRSEQVLKVLAVVGTSTKKLKSSDSLQVMSGLLDITATIASLTPGMQPIAVLFTALSLAIGFADKSKTESQKMQDFIRQALWASNMNVRKEDVQTFLSDNTGTIKGLKRQIDREREHRGLITLGALKDSLGNQVSQYGQVISALWTIIKNNIELTGQTKTPENGRKIYDLICLYVKAVILRDAALAQFKLATDRALQRNCRDWPRAKRSICHPLTQSERTEMIGMRSNVNSKLRDNGKDVYIEVGQFLEEVKLSRAPVLLHYHPIGWNKDSRLIHEFVAKYPPPGMSSDYQFSWRLTGFTKDFVVQPANNPDKHIEPERYTMPGYNDYLQLETSECYIKHAVTFTKINMPNNLEKHGYFKIKSYEYTSAYASNWDTLRYWRFYGGSSSKLRLDLDNSVSQVDNNILRMNRTGAADEYLFIVLEQEYNDVQRCDEGTKPRVTIIPKLARKKKAGKGMFLGYTTAKSKMLEEQNEYKDDSDPNSYTSEWLLHDCQGQDNCPGCDSTTYQLSNEWRSMDSPNNIDGQRQCPHTIYGDWEDRDDTIRPK